MARRFPGCTAELSKRALKTLFRWEEQPTHITGEAELRSRNKRLSFMQGFSIYLFGGLIIRLLENVHSDEKYFPCAAIFTSVHSQDVTGSVSFRD